MCVFVCLCVHVYVVCVHVCVVCVHVCVVCVLAVCTLLVGT